MEQEQTIKTPVQPAPQEVPVPQEPLAQTAAAPLSIPHTPEEQEAYIQPRWQKLVDTLNASGRPFQMDVIEKAYRYAKEKHRIQLRKSGEPYIIHPLAVATIVTELGMDTESVAAALLHDVVEDTDATLEEVTKLFGKEIAALIDGVTKIGRIPYSSREEQQAENIRKMLIAMAKDIRVIIIKLADRLHNMRTSQYWSPQKQRDKALENMEVYAPIAHRLGIRAVKEELEDLSIRVLDPIGYSEIEKALELRKAEREEFIRVTKERIRERVAEMIPDVYLEGRVKSINGIYRKMYVQGKSFDEIYDIYAVRVIVHTVTDCYNVLGIIHDMFRPIPNRFKDYISTPKQNMYQSLHTTVLGKEGIPFEVQIRTWEMHHTAEYGIAAHWKYKLGMPGSEKNDKLEERVAWVRQLLENQAENGDATDLIHSIKTDIAPEEVFVFTPKGDVIRLPTGATVIDFAYAIHSAVGNRMTGAKVDGKIVPLDYQVKIGDVIEIMTTKEAGSGPRRDWLNIARTSEARNKIRQWFKKEKREENIEQGRQELEKEFRHVGFVLNEDEMQTLLQASVRRQHLNTPDDLYAAIGYGGLQISRLMVHMKEDYAKIVRERTPDQAEEPIVTAPVVHKVSNGVVVDGVPDCLVKFSRCCNPLPGDAIIGFITRGFGVSVHKRSCKNVPVDLSTAPEPERWVPVHWASEIAEDFKAVLEINAVDREGLLADITIALSSMHIMIHSLNSRGLKDGNAVIYATITVHGMEHINAIITRLRSISGVNEIRRT